MALELHSSPWQEVSFIFVNSCRSLHLNHPASNVPTVCFSLIVMVTSVLGLLNVADMLLPVHDLDYDRYWQLYTE